IDEHDAAEALLDSELMRLPRHDGRIDLPHLRRRAVGHHLDLLIDRGRNDDAFRVARRSRSRFARSLLRSVDDEALQRTGFLDRRDAIDAQLATSADWSGGHLRRLQADAARDLALLRSELDAVMAGGRPITVVDRQPVDGELSLTVHPGEASWWLFASSVDGIDVFRLDDLDALFDQQRDGTGNPDQLAEEWADRLLTPVAARLRAARSVRFLAYGVLHAIDLHALPFDGAPLIEQVTVAYGVDLPTVKRDGELGPSVVIGDPSGDLAAARNEAAQVFRLLQPFGAIHHLDGLAATGAVVRQHLDGADHVHYAGHAHFAGWDSHLLLADGSSLTVDDILALRRPPRTVVLASCEAGRAVAAGGRETFDLARAFATAGSTAVIAATRPVSDEVTGRLMSTLYDAWTGSGGLTGDAAAALRQAQRRLRETDPDADWAAFRLIER
ncbi:MAG: CHAT domain-containing protein, partial [Acidobacteriota bacterium]